ncbi:LLM class flavin-dependent oxidoreductase [Dactylosporangium fulvum]|uniref:NtaA/DmoA family FMN-dependent monooxygenase n=1 Tax=Dactylosporangium fulvum TaxID=53359 RepID=A0ABY5VN97_9ACTN|nr:NtaA/DmoA family FMN-dependent monooxygenase [Dactylosporangium fulvum]UWP78925.1 NtaA/DmoA family FMN-dependent monooxygenase [Dactylosporangium fulvum]
MSSTKKLTLALQILGIGVNSVAWRLPGSPAERLYDLDLFTEVAERAEAAKIHTLFLSDGLTTSAHKPSGHFEPITFLTALGARTRHIGLVPTVSTTYTEPFNLARQLASVDHLTRGRAGWNIVTSAWGEENFGLPPLAHTDRYRRAHEFVQAAIALWESWEADARVFDRESGVSVRHGAVRQTDFVSEHFRIKGPLNIDRAPQGRPFLFQAGSSADGLRLGAAYADAIFAAHPDERDGVEFYQTFKGHVSNAGRDPDSVKVMPGLYAIIGESSQHAREIAQQLAELAGTADFASQRRNFERAGFGETDLSDLDPDRPIPVDRLPDPKTVQGRRSRYEIYRKYVLEGSRTLREMVLEFNASGSGHWAPVGSAEEIADQIESRFASGSADGFVLSPQHFQGYRLLTDRLVPELQRRGLFQTAYTGRTFRENVFGPAT